jgi:undecaprenyl-diphosphatase
LAGAAILGHLALRREFSLAWLGAAAWGGALLLDAVLRAIAVQPRAVLASHLTDLWSPAFPGGGAALSAAAYLSLGALLARRQRRRPVKLLVMAVAATAVVVVGTSRIYLRVHDVSDVLAGWLAGLLWASACVAASRCLAPSAGAAAGGGFPSEGDG